MDSAAEAVISPEKQAGSIHDGRLWELSTKTVDNFVNYFGALALSHGPVRSLLLCRNIEQSTKPNKIMKLNNHNAVKAFCRDFWGNWQNSVHKSSFASPLWILLT
ncbi:hypothetical protein PTW32_03560 [Dechloromonas agitata]|uniref:hypothetical protein n=1 Tax=Dechloromonas agitata TaxID=73030 RepID=UPI00237DDDAE|nr:hypothetical protein [Dechloromonas agitata]MDE1544484.1 hypothetical protein [Dechloromonas agitata]